MKRCVNIDWLELYCLEDPGLYPCNLEYFCAQGYTVRARDYGTRQYKEMFTIMDRRGEPWIEVRRNPVSGKVNNRIKGIFSEYSCHIRLHNRACYADDAVTALEDFLYVHRYNVRRIFRLDICLDFVRFDKGDDPNEVMQRYMKGRYAKINQANIAAHGIDRWNGRLWNSLSWGNPKSMVSTKFYCKSMELDSSDHDKPYIRYAWFLCGLIDDWRTMTKTTADGKTYKPDVWRVEFSIRASRAAWYVIEKDGHVSKKEEIPHTLNLYETRPQLLTAFASLQRHYFKFKKYREDIRKDRCDDKVLFDFSQEAEFYKLNAINLTARPRDKSLHTLIRRIELYRDTHTSRDVYQACETLHDQIGRASCRERV